ACAKGGDVDVALNALQHLQSMDLDSQTLHVLSRIDVAFSVSDVNVQDLFCQFMTCLSISNREHPEPYLLQKSSPYGKLLSVDDRCRLAEETFQLMQTKYDLPVVNKTLNSLLFVYALGNKTKPALSVFESFADHNLDPDLESYKALLSPFVKAILSPERTELDRLLQSKSWNPSDQIQA
ncbi:hypothetical protein BVRB_028170, partial [Beta vulgaris subsp. vulgaris]